MTPSLTKLLVGALALLSQAPAMYAQTPARPKPQRPIEVPPAVVVLQIDTTEGDSTRTIIQRDFDYGDRLQPLVLDSLKMADIWKPARCGRRTSGRNSGLTSTGMTGPGSWTTYEL